MTKQFLAGLAATCLVLGACSDGDETKDGCTTAADCAEGEICDNGTCKTDAQSACNPACSDPTPICDEDVGKCLTCTATEGCSGGTPICDPTAGSGVGACVGCRNTDDCTAPSVCDTVTHKCVGCTATEGCSGETPVCDDGTCVACTADEGCEAGQVCDTSASGGECVTCTATAGCATGLVCDTGVDGGICVTCTATAGCATGQICDVDADGGKCVECKADTDCKTASQFCDETSQQCVNCLANATNEGCSGETPLCYAAANGGDGACVGCLSDDNCEDDKAPVCHPDLKTCVLCAADSDCDDELVCMTSVACVACTSDDHCGGNTPICDPNTNECVGCLTAGDCTEDAPICDDVSMSCVVCTDTVGCDGASPFCDTEVPGGICRECTETAGCEDDEVCDPDGYICVFENTAQQITAVRETAPGSGLALPVERARVTYVRPSLSTDPAGFFVQATATGPALFVAIVPTLLTPTPAVGDVVSFTVNKTSVVQQRLQVTAIENLTIVSSGHDIAPLIQDVSAVPDVATAFGDYEFEIVSISGKLASAALYGGWYATIIPPGMTSGPIRFLVPTTLRDELALVAGCEVAVFAGPMWRRDSLAFVSVFNTAEFAVTSCPGPTVLSAAPASETSVVVFFDAVLLDSSVLADGSQFTIDGLTVSNAVVQGKTVTLTTSPQNVRAPYTVTVAPTVTGVHGDALGTPYTADFAGHVTLASLRIDEVAPNIDSAKDLVELKVLTAGSTRGLELVRGTSRILATLPDVEVAAGDLIVVHFNSKGMVGETQSKDEGDTADHYPGAWDFLGDTTGIDFTMNESLLVRTPARQVFQDAVAFYIRPNATMADVRDVYEIGQWLPADCGGSPCTDVQLRDLAVRWDGCGTTATGDTVYRYLDTDTDTKDDWVVGINTIGAENPAAPTP